MSPFPFKQILIRSVKLVLRRPWFWVFGIFLSWHNILQSQMPSQWRSLHDLEQTVQNFDLNASVAWLAQHIWQVGFVLLGLLAIMALFAYLYGLAKAAVIAGMFKILNRDEVQDERVFIRAWQAGQVYAWRVVGLRLLTGLILLVSAVILILPIWYLYQQGLEARLAILSLLALIIFGVTLIFVMFAEIFGANFLVLGRHRVFESFVSGLELFKRNWPTSILFGVFLILTQFILLIIMGVLIIGGQGLAEWLVRFNLTLPAPIMATTWEILITLLGWAVIASFSQAAWTYFWFKLAGMEKTENAQKALVSMTEKSIVPTPKTELE